MLTLITLFVIGLVGFIVGALIERYTYYEDGWALLLYAIATISTTALFVCGMSLVNIDRRFEARMNEYEAITAMVESYDGQEYGNMQTLTEEIVSMNIAIANHKALYGNKWTGIWYSEDIAKLEPIKFGKKTVLKE